MRDKSMEQKKPGQNFLFFKLNSEERESAIYYFLEAILRVRDSRPGLSGAGFFDEDVNIYLAHLLFAMSLPEYHDMADPFISSDPGEVSEWIRQADDPMLRYFIYKVNADNLLVKNTLFAEKPGEVNRVICRKTEKGTNRLAVAYYDHAARCHKGIYHKKTGVGQVLDKISGRYELYRKILLRIREDYFQFIHCFREQAFDHFFAQMNRYERFIRKDDLLDQFLGVYQSWLVSKVPESRDQARALAMELKKIDPEFRFDLSKLS